MEEETLKISIWTEPFNFYVWICIAASFVGALYVHHVSQRRHQQEELVTQIFSQIAPLFGQAVRWESSTKLKVLLCAAYFVSFFLGSLYSNGITSVVLVPKRTKSYQNIEEMLDLGYKIVWFAETDNVRPEQYLGHYFNSKGMKGKLNNSFILVPGKYSLATIAAFLSKKNILIWESYFVKGLARQIQLELGEGDQREKKNCYAARESIHNGFLYWYVSTINRYWVHKSIARIHESGLSQRHIEVLIGADKKHFKEEVLDEPHTHKPFIQQDVVTLSKLLIVLFLSLLILSGSLVVFLLEARFRMHAKLIFALASALNNPTLIVHLRPQSAATEVEVDLEPKELES